MNRNEELLRKQLELLAERSESAMEDDLPRLSSAMVDIYDRLERPSTEKQGGANMENIEKKALIVIRTGIRAITDSMPVLLTERGFGHDIQDDELREMYYQLNLMSVQLTERIEMPETSAVPEQATMTDLTFDEDA